MIGDLRCALCMAGGDFVPAITILQGWAVCTMHFEHLGEQAAGRAVADAAEDLLRGEGG